MRSFIGDFKTQVGIYFILFLGEGKKTVSGRGGSEGSSTIKSPENGAGDGTEVVSGSTFIKFLRPK